MRGTVKKQGFKKARESRFLYLMFILPLIYFIVFKYGAMAYLIIAFEDFNAFKGIFHSEWVG